MDIKGKLLIRGTATRGTGAEITSIDAKSGKPFGEGFPCAGADQIEAALSAAWEAFPSYRKTKLEDRAQFLDTVAERIGGLGEILIERASRETGLPPGRIQGERDRTVNQLKMFAEEVRGGRFLDIRLDPANPDRKPAPKPDLRMRNIAIGPVAVFGASNFPLAFSVAGGDTASALAAGCPVIVKAHSAHPGTSELVGRAVQQAVADCGLHPGVFSLLFGNGADVGQTLVADHRIKAVGFTGSRRGGVALMETAARRRQPIPVYAEMSSINPVILFPSALENRADEIARSFVASLTLGAGQFCTNPGLVIAIDSPHLQTFLDTAGKALSGVDAQTMLTCGMAKSFASAVERMSNNSATNVVARGKPGSSTAGQAALFVAEAADFLEDYGLQDEVFGASSLVIRCRDDRDLQNVLASLEGQLTVSLHIDNEDIPRAKPLIETLELLAGRLLVNGFGTGVEVSPAMVHGGPFPATSDGRSTSVGTLAIYRFLRPVCYQDFPKELRPSVLS